MTSIKDEIKQIHDEVGCMSYKLETILEACRLIKIQKNISHVQFLSSLTLRS